MRVILILIAVALVAPTLTSCDKYKLVNKKEEAQKAQEDKIKDLEEKVATLTEKAEEEEKKEEEKPKVIIVREGDKKKPKIVDKSAPKPKGWVRLYDDAGFTDRRLTVGFGRNIGNFHNISSDDGKSGFNDKTSSVKFSVPAGWKVVLYENSNYAKRGYPLKGKGSIADLGYFGDKTSSIRWERK